MSRVVLSAGPIARARNGVIGRDGKLPWRLRTDLANFRAVTMGKPIIMGRKTFESLPGGALPGRTNIVLTHDQAFRAPKVLAVDDFSEALQIGREQAAEDGADEVFVIGGASLFELALPKAGRLYLTEVEAEVPGDVVLSPIDESRWREVSRESHPAGERDEYPFTIRVLERL
jgi:dihydrofolate reductase